MTVHELYDELTRLLREDPSIEDYAVVDEYGLSPAGVRPDAAYQELNLDSY